MERAHIESNRRVEDGPPCTALTPLPRTAGPTAAARHRPGAVALVPWPAAGTGTLACGGSDNDDAANDAADELAEKLAESGNAGRRRRHRFRERQGRRVDPRRRHVLRRRAPSCPRTSRATSRCRRHYELTSAMSNTDGDSSGWSISGNLPDATDSTFDDLVAEFTSAGWTTSSDASTRLRRRHRLHRDARQRNLAGRRVGPGRRRGHARLLHATWSRRRAADPRTGGHVVRGGSDELRGLHGERDQDGHAADEGQDDQQTGAHPPQGSAPVRRGRPGGSLGRGRSRRDEQRRSRAAGPRGDEGARRTRRGPVGPGARRRLRHRSGGLPAPDRRAAAAPSSWPAGPRTRWSRSPTTSGPRARRSSSRHWDATDVASHAKVIGDIFDEFGDIDLVYAPAGILGSQDAFEADPVVRRHGGRDQLRRPGLGQPRRRRPTEGAGPRRARAHVLGRRPPGPQGQLRLRLDQGRTRRLRPGPRRQPGGHRRARSSSYVPVSCTRR